MLLLVLSPVPALCRKVPNEPVTLAELQEVGVSYWHFNPETYEADAEYAKLKADRGFTYQDTIAVSPATLPGYEEKIKVRLRSCERVNE